jgi:ABC-type hemin transport system substrate-binding protein
VAAPPCYARARRIASLLPSATEIVCALGAQRELVGISHECDHPEGLAGLPVLTRARLGPVRTIEIAGGEPMCT